MITIFMAEDDPLMSRMYGRAFKANGFDLKEASNGEAAIEVLKEMKPKPTIALIDIMMPNKSGFDVLRAMKEDDDLKNIPVVLFSNLGGQEEEKKGLKLGATAYLTKSDYSPRQVIDKVNEIIAKHS